MLMLGREIELPVDLIYGPHPQNEEFPDQTKAVYEYTEKMQDRMWKVQEKARKNIVKASDRQKRFYDMKAQENTYKVGDVVWLHTLLRVKRRSPKLQRNWDGPYFVTDVMSDVTYKIQKSPTSKFQIVHHDRLKPFYGEVDNWLLDVQHPDTEKDEPGNKSPDSTDSRPAKGPEKEDNTD